MTDDMQSEIDELLEENERLLSEWAIVDTALEEATARLLAIKKHVEDRTFAARVSLSRMHGGEPFPPMLDAALILKIVAGGASDS